MNDSPTNPSRDADRAPLEPEAALRVVRQLGLGLLVASLFIDGLTRSYAQWRRRASALQYRVLPDEQVAGFSLADLAVEILNGTSPR